MSRPVGRVLFLGTPDHDRCTVMSPDVRTRSPAAHELDLIATAQRARTLGHVAFFLGRHADGDHGALGQIRLGVDLLLRAEQRWPALRAAILTSTTG